MEKENSRYDFYNSSEVNFSKEYIDFVNFFTDMGLSIKQIDENSEKNRIEIYFNRLYDLETFMNFSFGITSGKISSNICERGNKNWKYSMSVINNDKSQELHPLTYEYIIKIPTNDFNKIFQLIKKNNEDCADHKLIYVPTIINTDNIPINTNKYKNGHELYKLLKLCTFRFTFVNVTKDVVIIRFNNFGELDRFNKIMLKSKLKSNIIKDITSGHSDRWRYYLSYDVIENDEYDGDIISAAVFNENDYETINDLVFSYKNCNTIIIHLKMYYSDYFESN